MYVCMYTTYSFCPIGRSGTYIIQEAMKSIENKTCIKFNFIDYFHLPETEVRQAVLFASLGLK